MIVYGRGKIAALPDMASIIIGVETEGTDLKNIQQQNASVMSQVIEELRNLRIPEGDIRTQSYMIHRVYDYIDNKQVFKGYKVVNTVRVNLRDMGRIGEVIDGAVLRGANLVENIEFALSNPSFHYWRAFRLAFLEALDKARAMERIMGVSLDETPVRVIEESQGYIPMTVKAAGTPFEAATPISPGILEITADIKAIFRYRL